MSTRKEPSKAAKPATKKQVQKPKAKQARPIKTSKEPVRTSTTKKGGAMSTDTKKKPANKMWLADAPPDKVFYCNDGQKVKNLADLAKTLRRMSPETFKHHVTDHKNDFGNWIGDVIGDASLAKDIRRATTHSAAANQVETRLAWIKAAK
jgi:hypothetical protein